MISAERVRSASSTVMVSSGISTVTQMTSNRGRVRFPSSQAATQIPRQHAPAPQPLTERQRLLHSESADATQRAARSLFHPLLELTETLAEGFSATQALRTGMFRWLRMKNSRNVSPPSSALSFSTCSITRISTILQALQAPVSTILLHQELSGAGATRPTTHRPIPV